MLEDPRHAFETLTRLATLREAATRGELASHRAKLLALAARLPPGSRDATVLGVLAEALLLDLAFLRTWPDALLSTLLWRCSQPGGPESEALGSLARRWLEERAPGSVWVRALGPPPHAPGGPLLAELHTAHPHTLLSPMSAGGHVLLDGRGVFLRWSIEEGTLADTPAVTPPTHPLKLVIRGWEGAALHDAATDWHRCELAMPEDGSSNAGSFSPDGTLVALAGSGDEYAFGFVYLYEAATGRAVRKWEGPRPFCKAPVFSPDGRYLLAPGDAGLFLWEIATGQEERLLIHDAEGAAFSEDGRRLVTTHGVVVRVWDLERLRALEPGAAEPSGPLVFSPDGRRLVVGDWLCDGPTGRRLRKLDIHRGRYLEGGPTPKWFTCGNARIVSLQGGVRVWETESGEPLAHRGDVYYPHWYVTASSEDGLRYAAARKGSAEAEVLDVDTGAVLAGVETAGDGLECLAMSPDGQWLAGGTREGTIELWSTVSGQRLVTLSGHTAPVCELAFSRDGRRLVSAGDNEALRLWALPGGAALASRPLDARDSPYSLYQGGVSSTRRSWRATPEALRALSGWEGFVGPRAGPFSTEVQGGVTLFLDRQTRRPVAAFPTAGPWLQHPDGERWVSPSAYVLLEGVPGDPGAGSP